MTNHCNLRTASGSITHLATEATGEPFRGGQPGQGSARATPGRRTRLAHRGRRVALAQRSFGQHEGGDLILTFMLTLRNLDLVQFPVRFLLADRSVFDDRTTANR